MLDCNEFGLATDSLAKAADYTARLQEALQGNQNADEAAEAVALDVEYYLLRTALVCLLRSIAIPVKKY